MFYSRQPDSIGTYIMPDNLKMEMNRFAEVGFSLVYLDVSMASHSQQLIHGISDQRSGSLFILGLCVLRAVYFYRFMLSFS